MTLRFIVCTVTSTFALAACSGATPPAAHPEASAAVRAPMPRPADSKSPTRAFVQIAAEIRQACGIQDSEAYFHFDSARITADEHDVLKRVAVCFESGPLAGRSMHLVGRADPRGESEYNMVLGGSRADAVKDYLRGSGVRGTQMATTSRGELDATGTDEPTWAKDRRVDILLDR